MTPWVVKLLVAKVYVTLYRERKLATVEGKEVSNGNSLGLPLLFSTFCDR